MVLKQALNIISFYIISLFLFKVDQDFFNEIHPFYKIYHKKAYEFFLY